MADQDSETMNPTAYPPRLGRPLLLVFLFIALGALTASFFMLRDRMALASLLAPVEKKTEVQKLGAKTGAVIIMGYSEIGTMETKEDGRKVTVEAREFIDAASGTRQAGIVITIGDGRSTVDADEVEPLIRAVQTIAQTNKSATKLAEFQADYRTRDQFRVSSYSSKEKKIGASISAAGTGYGNTFGEPADLEALSRLLQKAQSVIAGLK